MPCPNHYRRIGLLAAVLCCAAATVAVAQQLPNQPPVSPAVQPLPPVPQQAAGQPLPAQAPPGFELNALQQAFLNQVLSKWETESGKINTFSCNFERLDFNAAFSPALGMPLSIDQGELSYQRPDKGSFQITEIKKWQQKQGPQGQQPADPIQGEYVVQKEAIGEHWVCDGKSIFEYRHNQELLVEQPIPPQLQGQAIANGPLPFLFGAEAAKLKARYWMKISGDSPTEIWLEAVPKNQADAANFSRVRVILDRVSVLPKAMELNLPDKSRHVYKFDLANASINNPLARLGALFQRPRTPFGWKRVVEQMPLQQAAQPAQPPR